MSTHMIYLVKISAFGLCIQVEGLLKAGGATRSIGRMIIYLECTSTVENRFKRPQCKRRRDLSARK
jgi:hypothetical protein